MKIQPLTMLTGFYFYPGVDVVVEYICIQIIYFHVKYSTCGLFINIKCCSSYIATSKMFLIISPFMKCDIEGMTSQ